MMKEQTAHKRLVIVRAGDDSLHETWLRPEKQNAKNYNRSYARNYDCIIAYYGEKKNKWQRKGDANSGITHMHIKGGKWDGVYSVFADNPALLNQYQSVWIPDDDIEATPEAVEKMFTLHEQYNLQLSQPALTHSSYFSYFGLLKNPAFQLRFSNFVEIMMPCMTTALLRNVLPFLKGNRTGTMLDRIWHRFTKQPAYAAAIFDQVQMRHVRGVEKGNLSKKQKKHDIERVAHLLPPRSQQRHIFYGGVLTNGEKVMAQNDIIWPIFKGWYQMRHQIQHPIKAPSAHLLQHMRYQLTQSPQLTPLV